MYMYQMSYAQSLIPKLKNVCLWAILLSTKHKGYKCYNPVTRQVRVSRYVVFDELKSWYSDANDGIGADVKESVGAENAGSQSQNLSRPKGSPSTGSIENPWSGRLCEKTSPTGSSNAS